jgi:hypothetical protein
VGIRRCGANRARIPENKSTDSQGPPVHAWNKCGSPFLWCSTFSSFDWYFFCFFFIVIINVLLLLLLLFFAEKGEVYTWGRYGTNKFYTSSHSYVQTFLYYRGDHGRLGHGDTASLPYPKLVSALRGIPIIDISSGGGHNAVLTGILLHI